MGQPADADLQTGRHHLSGDQSAEQAIDLKALKAELLAWYNKQRAAEDMYEALCDCVSLIDGEISGPAQRIGILSEARAAIAKAEGRDR